MLKHYIIHDFEVIEKYEAAFSSRRINKFLYTGFVQNLKVLECP